MKSSASLLFSLIMLAVIMLFTAEKLKVLMHGEQADQPAQPEAASFTETGLTLLANAANHLETEFLSWFKPAPDTRKIVITEDTVIRTYTWVDDQGERQYSKTAPEGIEAEVILTLPPEMIPESNSSEPGQLATSGTPEKDMPDSTSASSTTDAGRLNELLTEIPEGADKTRFMEGLKSFRELQKQQQQY